MNGRERFPVALGHEHLLMRWQKQQDEVSSLQRFTFCSNSAKCSTALRSFWSDPWIKTKSALQLILMVSSQIYWCGVQSKNYENCVTVQKLYMTRVYGNKKPHDCQWATCTSSVVFHSFIHSGLKQSHIHIGIQAHCIHTYLCTGCE